MPLIKDIEVQLATVSPAAGERMLKTFGFSRQRNISVPNVRRLNNAMVSGTFIEGTPLTMCRLKDGTCVLMNGHHTLHAIIRSGVTLRLTIIVLHVEDMEAAAQVYATMDLHKTRSWLDAARAANLDTRIPMISKVLPALGIIGNNFRFRTDSASMINSRKVRLDLVTSYEEEAKLMQAALFHAPKMHGRAIVRSPVMSVALETSRYQPAKAYDFWSGVAQDDCLSSVDPRKTLLRWLLQHPLGGGTTQIMQQFNAARLAWNAYYRGDPLTILKVNSPGIQILGTPWGSSHEPDPLPTDLDLPEWPTPNPTPTAPDVLDLFTWGRQVDAAQANGLRTVGFNHPPGRA
jgi:hypothetical protein